jgi:hypothetical protein
MSLVELQNFVNDLVTDSPHMGRSAPTSTDHQGGNRLSKKRSSEPEGTKRRHQGEGSGFARGRGRGGNRGGRRRSSSHT